MIKLAFNKAKPNLVFAIDEVLRVPLAGGIVEYYLGTLKDTSTVPDTEYPDYKVQVMGFESDWSEVPTDVGGTSQINNQPNKDVEPSTSKQIIKADKGYTGLTKVTVKAVTPTIDENIQASNIKEDVTILGVTGSVIDGYRPRYIKSNSLFQNYTGEELDYEISKLDVRNLTTFQSMFSNCTNLKRIDMSNWIINNNVDMQSLCYNGNGLELVTLPETMTGKITSLYTAFQSCTHLTDVVNLDDSKVTAAASRQATFNACAALTRFPLTQFTDTEATKQLYAGCVSADPEGVYFNLAPSFTSLRSSGARDYSQMFKDTLITNANLPEIINLKFIDVTASMFENCTGLTSIHVKLPAATNYNQPSNASMFKGCTSLTSAIIDIEDAYGTYVSSSPNWGPQLGGMFEGCTSLTTAKMSYRHTGPNSNWRYKNYSSFGSIFKNCTNLTSVDLTGLSPGNVSGNCPATISMFEGCTSLTTVDVSPLCATVGEQKYLYLNRMFYGCTNLQHIDFRTWGFSKMTYGPTYYQDVFTNVPTDCEIIVKDDTEKASFQSKFPAMTNVKTVAEYEAE